MTRLFKRDIRILVADQVIEGRDSGGQKQPLLKLTFDIEKTADRSANTCVLSIWNLNEQTRSWFQETGVELVIEAGYIGERNQIYKGDVETATIMRESVDWIVRLESGDGSKALKSKRINESLRGPQKLGTVLEKAANALGLDIGNLKEQVRTDGARSVLKQLLNNIVLSGKAADVLDEISSAAGLNFSVQDKALQFVGKGGHVSGPAIALDDSKGLIGSPEVGEKGVVTAKSLLNGRIKPGVLIDLESLLLDGEYVVQKVKHNGDTWGDDWTTTMEMVEA